MNVLFFVSSANNECSRLEGLFVFLKKIMFTFLKPILKIMGPLHHGVSAKGTKLISS